MPFKKNDPNIDRRGRIGPNKFTSLKQSFLDAFESIGGTQALIDWMIKDGTITYYDKKTGEKKVLDVSGDRKKEFFKMISGMLPKEVAVTGSEGGAINLLIEEARKRTQSVNEKPTK